MLEPTDLAERVRIAERTDQTLFVTAGAGSGKTSSLVSRVTQLVLEDGVPMEHIATVTFTIKAGAELRDRLQPEFRRIVLEKLREITASDREFREEAKTLLGVSE